MGFEMQVTSTANMGQLTPELAVAAEDLLQEYSKLHCTDSRRKGKAWKHAGEPLKKELRQGNLQERAIPVPSTKAEIGPTPTMSLPGAGPEVRGKQPVLFVSSGHLNDGEPDTAVCVEAMQCEGADDDTSHICKGSSDSVS